jgi:hypothetical protein
LFLSDPKLKLGENERVEFSTVSEVGAFAKSCGITGPSSEVEGPRLKVGGVLNDVDISWS